MYPPIVVIDTRSLPVYYATYLDATFSKAFFIDILTVANGGKQCGVISFDYKWTTSLQSTFKLNKN